LELKWVVVQEQISGTESYFDGPPAATAYSLKIDEDENVMWPHSASDSRGDEREVSGHAAAGSC